jgi:hypothetical protein
MEAEWGFDFEKGGYHFVSKEKDGGNSEITISRGERVIRKFLFPSYKIWNIPAHADDIILGLEQESDSGLEVAGSDGLGGNAYPG